MRCIYCGEYSGHKFGCPFYEPSKPKHYCSICDEGIRYGDEYVVNHDDEYAHLDCLYDNRNMAEFLGVKIGKME